MGNVAINLSDISSLPSQVDKAVTTLETLVEDLAPIEAALPLPSSVKNGFADLEKFLAIAKKFLDQIS